MTLTKAERYALEILDGCPTGATQHALAVNRGIAGGTLWKLVDRDLVRPQEQELTTGMKLWRFWITDAGRKARKA